MDQMLKQRLIGAIVIISLAVIFIPMILEGPNDKLSPRSQDMPPPPRIDYQAEVKLPVPAESAETPESPAPGPTVTETPASSTPESPAEQPEPATEPPETATEPPETATKQTQAVETAKTPTRTASKPSAPQAPSRPAAVPALSAGDWIVQVGSFSQQPNAISLRDRLKKSGYEVNVQDAKGAGGPVYRVLIGPVTDRGAAEKLRDKLAREQRIKGMVLQNK
jgi:DedD protein